MTKKTYKVISSALVVLTLLYTNLAFAEKYGDALNVSIYTLLGSPQKYHGKKVQVIGFVNIEHEGNALYAHKQDFEEAILKNSIWLDMRGSKLPKFNKRYSVIQGTFDYENNGHFGLFSGTIKDIEYIEISKNRKEVMEEASN